MKGWVDEPRRKGCSNGGMFSSEVSSLGWTTVGIQELNPVEVMQGHLPFHHFTSQILCPLLYAGLATGVLVYHFAHGHVDFVR